jgi:hypothetical protein
MHVVQERRRADFERRRWEEKQRIETLDEQMSHWNRARDVRAYAQAVEEFAVQHYGKLDHPISTGVLLAGYALPQVVGGMLMLPGGVGAVEATMIGLYATLGTPTDRS